MIVFGDMIRVANDAPDATILPLLDPDADGVNNVKLIPEIFESVVVTVVDDGENAFPVSPGVTV